MPWRERERGETAGRLELAQADRGAGGGQTGATCPNSTASGTEEEDLGSTLPWIAPSMPGSSTDTAAQVQAGENKREGESGEPSPLKKARHQVTELLRSQAEETLAAVAQAYGEDAPRDPYERDRRAQGEERAVGTKAATQAAAAAEHIQEALQLARSIELHGVEAHLSAAATSLSLAAPMGQLGDGGHMDHRRRTRSR